MIAVYRDMVGTIQDYYTRRLVPLALEGLRRMLLPEAVFCDTLRQNAGAEPRPSGRSYRYSAMVLIGLAMQERLGCSWGVPTEKVWGRLFDWATKDARLGDAGLVLWAMVVKGDPRGVQVAENIIKRESEVLDARSGIGSMPLGWLLAGLGLAMQNDLGGSRLASIAEKVCRRLLGNRNQTTSLFALGGSEFRRNPLRRRLNSRLGSFASQVYPMIGLSFYATASGRPEPLRVAEQTADAVCRLQGSEGQWWWIYDIRSAKPAIRYPVYSVHQHSMGPMALLAVSRAGQGKKDYSAAIRGSLDWLDKHPELAEETLFARDAELVWRAIQRDVPAQTADFGLGLAERIRMNLSAWTGMGDNRPFRTGYLCDECRPYELGWILVAGALACAARK